MHRVAPVNDVTITALQSMLRGLAERQRVINDNLANVETPGYVAKKVQFEDALLRAVRSGDGHVTPTVVRSTAPALPNGNNVQIDQEMVALEDTTLRYQLAVEAITAKLSVLRASIRSTG